MRTEVLLWLFGLGVALVGVFSTTTHATCTKENLDIFVVLDSSQSISERNFERLRAFLFGLVSHFRVGKFESRIGLMQYSHKMRTVIEFRFGEHETMRAVQENIKNLIHQDGTATHTGHALKMVNEKVFKGKNDDRPDAEKVLLLITDGEAHDTQTALREAEKLKKKGVHLITIGAGSNKWISRFKYQLSRLGSKPTHNHRVKFQELKDVTEKLVNSICNSRQRQPAPPHKCFQEKQDILVMIDGSRSIGARDFAKLKRFLQDILSRLDIGPSRVHFGVIQFSESHRTSIEIALNQYATVEDVMSAVAKIVYHGGSEADLANALRLAELTVLTGGAGDRKIAPDTVLIFTNGRYQDRGTVQEFIGNLRRKKTRVFSVAVASKEKSLDLEGINALASSPVDVYNMNTVGASSKLLEDLAPTTCKMTTCTVAPPKCSPENQDIIILMDGSARISSLPFRYAQKFIKRLVSKMTLGKNQTHVGVIQYGSTGNVYHVARLGKHVLRTDVMSRISKMEFRANDWKPSDLAYALPIAGDMLLNPLDPSRKKIPKTVVIITDGDMIDFPEALAAADTLRNQKIRILTLSNGKNSKREQFVSSLRLLASGPKEYYRLENSYFNEVLKELQKTVCVSEPKLPKACFTQKRNIFFALDNSKGRGWKKFKEVKDFMDSVVRKLHLGPSQTRVGFLQFNDNSSPKGSLIFNKADSSAQILWNIQNMRYRRGNGSSNLGAALRVINQEVFKNDKRRDPAFKDILIILAHREIKDAQLAFDEAEKLKEKGVDIISIATANKKRADQVKSQLRVISSSPTTSHSADYNSLWPMVDEVLTNICGLGKCPAFRTTMCFPKEQDIVFVIDGSRSIGNKNFNRLQRFVRRLAERLDLAKDKTHLGLLQIGADKNAKFQFNLGEFPDRDDVLYMIKDMTYLDDMATYMGSGLRKIRQKVFNKGGPDRPSVPNTLVLFTDGQVHDQKEMFQEADKLKKMGVRILSVGYGKNITVNTFRNNLMRVATRERDVFAIDFKNNDLMLEQKIDVIATDLVQVVCPRQYAPPVECKQGAVDLFLLVDGSRSINPTNFRLVKKFLKKITMEFDIGANATHIGLLQFSDVKSMSYEFGFDDEYNNKEVKRAIKSMEYKAGGKTLTGDALRIVDYHVFNHKNGDRPRVPDVLLIFTDGRAHDFDEARKHAKALKERGVRIITIAAGHETENPESELIKQLQEIASDPLNVYTAQFSELSDIVDKLIDIDCVIVERKTS